MLNNTDRPPVRSRDGKRVLYRGQMLPHFNEVDECAGLDGLMTYRVHKAMGQPPENTLHDIRWGDWDASGTVDEWVWVFEISGSAPPAHFIKGWKGATGERQPAMYFRLGGSTLKGATIDSHGDHRIAMAFSIAALVAEGETTINDSHVVDVSFPGFYKTLEGLIEG